MSSRSIPGRRSRPRGRVIVDQWAEAIAGSALAAVVFLIPHLFGWIASLGAPLPDFFMLDAKIMGALGFGTAAAGAMLSLSRHQFQKHFEAKLHSVDQLATLVDIETEANHEDLRELVALYQRVANPSFVHIKRDIVHKAKRELSPMAFEQESPALSGSAYSREQTAQLRRFRSQPGEKVRAVATLFDGDFDAVPTAEEELFMNANLEMAQRGADFERLFVMGVDEYPDAIGAQV